MKIPWYQQPWVGYIAFVILGLFFIGIILAETL